MIAYAARSILHDLRYALRSLRTHPGFALATVLLLSLGIGGTTLVFSAVDAILLRDLPVRAPERLARVVEVRHNRPLVSEYPYRVFDEWRRRSRSFSAAFAQTDLDISYSDETESRPVRAQIVTGNYYTVLGVRPWLGRLLTEKDEWATNDELPVVLSYAFWERRFHRDPNTLGRLVHLEGRPFTVVGVTPAGFNGTSVDSGPDLQLPFIAGEFLTASGTKRSDPRSCCLWEIAGHLRADITFAQAQTETTAAMHAAFNAVFSQNKPLSAQDREWIERQHLRVEPIRHGVSWLRQKFSTGLLALLGAAVLLLLLACANVAGLMLARAAGEEQQNAIRLALGAPRRGLIQQWLSEGAVLSFVGGLLALLLTWAGLHQVDGWLPPMRDLMTRELPVALHVPMDFRLFTFAALLCCATTLLAAISPAWYASRAELLTPLKGVNSSRRNTQIRAFLVAGQVAICTMVLAITGLMVATLKKLEASNPGFRRDHIITFTIDTALQKYNVPQSYALALRLRHEAGNLPGVAAASIAVKPLLRGGGMRFSVAPIGGKRSPIEELNSDSNIVSPGYFETLGIRLLAGRTFADRDLRDGGFTPVVVNETFAQTFFPGLNAVGRYFDDVHDTALVPRYKIIGVAADSKYRSLRESAFPAVFLPIRTADDLEDGPFQLVVRTFVDPKSIVSSMDRRLRGIDPRLPFREIHTISEDLDSSLWAEHTLVRLGLLFSGLAMLLAAIGLYGLISYIVVERRREIGIRMALGARSRDVIRVTAVRTFVFISAGIAGGLSGSVVTAFCFAACCLRCRLGMDGR